MHLTCTVIVNALKISVANHIEIKTAMLLIYQTVEDIRNAIQLSILIVATEGVRLHYFILYLFNYFYISVFVFELLPTW